MFQQFFGARTVNIVYWTLTLQLAFYLIILLFYKFKVIKYIDIICGIWVLLLLLNLAKAYSSANVFPLYSSILDTSYQQSSLSFLSRSNKFI